MTMWNLGLQVVISYFIPQNSCAIKMSDLLGLFNQGSATARSHIKNLIDGGCRWAVSRC